MDAFDIATWNRCLELAKDLDIEIGITGKFCLYIDRDRMLGSFETVSDVYAFLCGYDHGYTKAYCTKGSRSSEEI